MTKAKEREKSIKLRNKGMSIGDIAKTVGVSKSTVSNWCRDIKLSKLAIKKISEKSKSKSTESLLRYAETLRAKRQLDILHDKQEGRKKIGVINSRDLYCIGLGLYWGEGYKKGDQEFGFTNSDPQMILFYCKWLYKIFNITSDKLILRVSVNELHKNRISEIEQYWSVLTGIPRSQFTKPSLIKVRNKKFYSNSKSHYGTLRIKVRKGTRLRRQVLGAIDSILF
ncbi:helix-turn-helix domain-containing protein [Candidatus Kaiserbacteria bacterium]|nr:helix-turn-helix domain-containing protein [Candidatus Kaiserbacteria bacterium]